MRVCVCVCVRARACVRACMSVCACVSCVSRSSIPYYNITIGISSEERHLSLVRDQSLLLVPLLVHICVSIIFRVSCLTNYNHSKTLTKHDISRTKFDILSMKFQD